MCKKTLLEAVGVEKSFAVQGNTVQALRGVNLSVAEGEFVSIVGHSGCGKSTLLKMIAGLECADAGKILLNGTEVREPNADCGMVFQEHRLLPWLKVWENIVFGLTGVSKAEKRSIAEYYLDIMRISEFCEAYPSQLSGGMAQRAAIARELATKPKLLLLDEPFSALDAMTRAGMQRELKRVRESQKTAMILVTHDIEEAVYLGDRVLVFSERPGCVRENITVALPAERDRNSTEFLTYKRQIFEYFQEKNLQ